MQGGTVVRSAPYTAVIIGSKCPGDETLSSIRRAERLVLQSHVRTLDCTARYRAPPHSSQLPGPTLRAYSVKKDVIQTRPASSGTLLNSFCGTGPFPPPALREQSAGLSKALSAEYTRAVRQVEGNLRRQAGRINEAATRLNHQKEKLEKLLRSVRTALLVNKKTTEERTRRPATETEKDEADFLLCHEKKGLNELKWNLDVLLKETLTQIQTLTQSSRWLLDCAFERSRVIELLPQKGPPSASVHPSISPLSLEPDPSGPFTPECKEVLESSAAVLQTSKLHSRRIEQVMCDVIKKQAALHQSVNEGLLQKIAQTQSLQQRLTMSSAATRQAIYRKKRQMQCASYSHGRALGPVSSGDLFCRERINRPIVQVYERHPTFQLPETRLLAQGKAMLKHHLEREEKTVGELQDVHLQLEDDFCVKRESARVDSAALRLRRMNTSHIFV
ncbi:coiled-coil domain-containing protein 105 [Silurus meridionalis]|uniref:Coiled-coil domain-containing protein 105 n=1 Tax=Silurus meridionalis TaxID=175797 RepID=A0A8T0B400_SILME|nr:coiled-coil domain-containing protein 105 [Silurus meridionalis]KAF7700255.1 hypothetical protein HF521_003213 [Silurus meridionalis]